MLSLLIAAVALQTPITPAKSEGIVWYGTLKAGLAEAKRTNRPILLMSANAGVS
jgi:hypothetical protein